MHFRFLPSLFFWCDRTLNRSDSHHRLYLLLIFQKDENVSIVVPLQPHCGEEMETAITYVMHAAFITK